MEWIRENSIFLLFFVLFITMHLFGHNMHGGHGSHSGHGEEGEHAGHDKNERKGSHGCC